MVQFQALNSVHSAELSQLASQIFLDTFLPSNKAQPVHDYVREFMSKEAFRETLESKDYTSIGVYVDARLVGYIQILVNMAESYESTPLELKRFYLDFSQHGKGIAADMMDLVFQTAKDLGYKKIWLGVWEKNDRAIRFYKKNGFRRVSSHMFNMGGEIQSDDIYVKTLD